MARIVPDQFEAAILEDRLHVVVGPRPVPYYHYAFDLLDLILFEVVDGGGCTVQHLCDKLKKSLSSQYLVDTGENPNPFSDIKDCYRVVRALETLGLIKIVKVNDGTYLTDMAIPIDQTGITIEDVLRVEDEMLGPPISHNYSTETKRRSHRTHRHRTRLRQNRLRQNRS